VIIPRPRDPRIPNKIIAILPTLQPKERIFGYITIIADTKDTKIANLTMIGDG